GLRSGLGFAHRLGLGSFLGDFVHAIRPRGCLVNGYPIPLEYCELCAQRRAAVSACFAAVARLCNRCVELTGGAPGAAMTVFAVNYLCREVLRDHAFRAAMKADPAKALAPLDLTDEERRALIAGDVGALYRMGVNGFLMGYLARFEVCGLDVGIYNERMRAVKVDEIGQPVGEALGGEQQRSPRASDGSSVGTAPRL